MNIKTRLETWLTQQWQIISWWQWLLRPLSWLFALISTGRRVLYRMRLLQSQALPVPVIVVGNVAVGGSGKTPLTIFLAQQLKQAGFYPGIISRGYGGQVAGEVLADSLPAQMGDEPVLIAQRTACPVWVDANRVNAGNALLKAYPQCNVIISDDGLQHYRLKRDIEIVVVQHPYGLGNRRLLPAGPLREPLSRLTQVQGVVEVGVDKNHSIAQIACPRFTMRLHSKVLVSLENPQITQLPTEFARQFSGQSVVAIAGIAHPQRFFQILQQHGIHIQAYAFSDHHHFVAEDFSAWQMQHIPILMTEKDAVKCKVLGLKNAWYLPVEAVIEGEQANHLIDLIKDTL